MTNLYPADIDLDPEAVARLGGVAAIDSYPQSVASPDEVAYQLDLARSMAPDGSLWVMEQQVGPVNWTGSSTPVDPARLREWLWQAAQHGARAVLLFRWRQALRGQEICHSGVLRWDGAESDAAPTIRSVVREIRATPIEPPERRVAMPYSHDDVWLLDGLPLESPPSHRSLQLAAYRAVRRLGLPVTFVGADQPLDGFDLVVAPGLLMWTPERVAALRDAARAGTLVVLGARSLSLDDEGAIPDVPLPAGITDQLGAQVAASYGAPDGVRVEPFGVHPGVWVDVLGDDGDADVLATLTGHPALEGGPVAVRRGGLVYAGFTSTDAWAALLAQLVNGGGLGGGATR